MEQLKGNPNSHLTAKERTDISFPARWLLKKGLLVGKVLDFGCGLGKDVEVLRSKGLNVVGYDRHYEPDFPTDTFDTIICLYVLNVLLPEEQATVLMQISRLLKPNGRAYFAVRRDVAKDGYRMHRIHQQLTYQCNVKLGFPSVMRSESCEVYVHQLYNQFHRVEHPECPFCNPEAERELLAESATAYAILDKFPVNKGHALIIPKRHVADYFQLTFKEQSACWFMVDFVKPILQERFNPDGFNIGINVGEQAGQTVPHVHIHLIPRYSGDVPEPRGGVRGVIPDKRSY
jgi:diadenosine tetraphosphate (Ap4A) HIT family hydrolase